MKRLPNRGRRQKLLRGRQRKVDRDPVHQRQEHKARRYRIALEHGRHAYVWLFPTKRRMQHFMRWRGYPAHPAWKALAATWTNTSRWWCWRQQVIAGQGLAFELYFNRWSLHRWPAEDVAHECCHAAVRMLSLERGWPVRSINDDERLATLTGQLTQAVANVLFPRRCWP